MESEEGFMKSSGNSQTAATLAHAKVVAWAVVIYRRAGRKASFI